MLVRYEKGGDRAILDELVLQVQHQNAYSLTLGREAARGYEIFSVEDLLKGLALAPKNEEPYPEPPRSWMARICT
jgi:hypothetical protein